jgi:hypothetical protein
MELIPKAVVKQQRTIDSEVFVFDLNDEIDANEISDICRFYKTDEFKETKTESVYAWRSDYTYTLNNKMPKFQPLLNVVTERIKLIWKMPYSFVIDHYWFAIYQNGDKAKEHDHGWTDAACVYYASTPDKSAPLVFPSIDGDVIIQPKQGMLVVFSGKCRHKVPKSEHDGERIIISMNVFKDKLLRFDAIKDQETNRSL